MSDEITIYWSPASFVTNRISQNMLYAKPESVLSDVHKYKTQDALIQQCPAHKAIMSNVFAFKSTVDDEFDLPPHIYDYKPTKENPIVRMDVESRVGMYHERPTSFEGYIDTIYGLSWLMFADEPVTARFTAPYYPAVAPVPGAILAPGEFNIGKWFRSFNMDYHIPVGSEKFSIRAGMPLFFLEVFTDKKIVFKRFMLNDTLMQLTSEMSGSPQNYGRHQSLDQRYSHAALAEMPSIILSEIRKNLID